VAIELAEHSHVRVNLIGGQLSHETQIIVGSQVIQQLSEIHADLCFLGTNSISVQKGLTDSDWEAVQVKKALIKSASETVVMSISEKIRFSAKNKSVQS